MSRGRRPDYQGGGTIIRPRDPAWYSDTDKKKKPKTVVIESERAKRRRAEREERELAKNVDALPPGMKSAYLIGTGGRGPKKLRFFADAAAKKWPLRGSLKRAAGCL